MSEPQVVNGVNVTELAESAMALKEQPDLAAFKFRVTNQWIGGGHNRTTVRTFHGLNQEIEHDNEHVLDADEPPVLLSGDLGTNPVEHLLHALVTCLTTSLVQHAATRGIEIEELESAVEGDIDLREFMDLGSDVPRGYENSTVTFRVKSDADERSEAARQRGGRVVHGPRPATGVLCPEFTRPASR